MTMAPIFICRVKIQMATTYIFLERKFIRISIVLKTRFQNWTYFELLIEKQRDIFLKIGGFFLKNCQDQVT